MTAAPPLQYRAVWTPFEGFQKRAVAAAEDESLIGGAKGPGKSDILLMRPLNKDEHGRCLIEYPDFKSLQLRRTFPELQELIDRSHKYYGRLSHRPHWNGQEKRWRWPSGAISQFGYCDTLTDVERYQGQEWAQINYDEIGKLQDQNVWTSLGKELRCRDPRVRRSMMGSANPGQSGHPWLKRRFVIPTNKGEKTYWEQVEIGGGVKVWQSRGFYPGRVTDNPIYANDPKYMATLYSLPERLRRQLLFGDWDAASGQALEELDAAKHFVRPFRIGDNWTQWCAFDWGWAHRWVWIWAAMNEDGWIYILDTLHGHRDRNFEIAERVTNRIPHVGKLRVAAGHDCFRDTRFEGERRLDNTPSISEDFQRHKIILGHANIARVGGLNNMRYWLAWRGLGPNREDVTPMCRFMDTPGNRWLFNQWESMVIDEDNPEDVLKVHADPESGEGGDDGYDCGRYLLADRPFAGRSTAHETSMSAFSPEVLAHEADVKRRSGTYSPDSDPRGGARGVEFNGLL